MGEDSFHKNHTLSQATVTRGPHPTTSPLFRKEIHLPEVTCGQVDRDSLVPRHQIPFVTHNSSYISSR